MLATQVAVSTTPVSLVAAAATPGRSVRVANRHASGSAFLGEAGVTITTGYELKAGETMTIDLAPGEPLYAVAAVASSCHVLVL